ncbi:MAG: type II toxin-antitoxin system prevent-host-death family antitoxin [bacterium]
MKFLNTAELKSRLDSVLADVARGEAVVVTRRGKPAATLVRTNEADLDQALFERSAVVKAAVREGLRDIAAGRVITAREYMTRRFGTRNGSRRRRT